MPVLYAAPAVKGTVMASLLIFVFGEAFLQALVIATVSAFLSGLFLLVATVITVREARQNRAVIRHMQRKMDADRRESDDGENTP